MKIQVKELGAIKEGTIDLSKKLNVFSDGCKTLLNLLKIPQLSAT